MERQENSRLFLESFLKFVLLDEVIKGDEIQTGINKALSNEPQFDDLKNSVKKLAVGGDRRQFVLEVLSAFEDIILAYGHQILNRISKSTTNSRAYSLLKYLAFLLSKDPDRKYWPLGQEPPPFLDFYRWLLCYEKHNIYAKMDYPVCNPTTARQYITDFSGALDILGHPVRDKPEYQQCFEEHKRNIQ